MTTMYQRFNFQKQIIVPPLQLHLRRRRRKKSMLTQWSTASRRKRKVQRRLRHLLQSKLRKRLARPTIRRRGCNSFHHALRFANNSGSLTGSMFAFAVALTAIGLWYFSEGGRNLDIIET